MDLISRKEAISAISRYGSVWMVYTNDMSKREIAEEALKSAKEKMICILKDLPDAEKTGKWMKKPDPYGFFDEIPVCSECGCTTKMREEYKYCPSCGAQMEVTK